MKKTALIASALVLGTGAATAAAQTRPNNYQGSDTLEAVATAVTNLCNESPALTYLGGGSGTGESGMVAGTQDIAPMSRPLKPTITAGHNACALYLADDAIAVLTAADPTCSNIAGTPAAPSTANAQGTLKLLYFGLGASGDGTEQTLVNGVNPGCSGDDRKALIANWNNIFACSGTKCTGALRHAFRRDDTSGTTDTLRAQLGVSTNLVNSAPQVPFCNGNDVGVLPANAPGYSAGRLQQDVDPVRTSCAATGGAASLAEDICGPIPYWNSNQFATIPSGSTTIPNPFNFAPKTLGVVLTAEVPTAFSISSQSVAASANDLFNPVACSNGAFKLGPNPSPVTSGATQICPDGSKPVGGSANLCYTPYLKGTGGAADSFACTSNPQASPTAISKANFDGRSFNAILRAADGSIRNVPPAGSLTSTRRVTTAFYRLHALGGASGAGRGCNTFLDTTHLFGCFPEADACTLAYAGYDSTKLPGDVTNPAVQAVTVNSQTLTQAGTSPVLANPNYLLYRKLWVNALNCDIAGASTTGTVTVFQQTAGGPVLNNVPDYNTLFGCYRSNGTQQALAAGFFPPAGANPAPAVQKAP